MRSLETHRLNEAHAFAITVAALNNRTITRTEAPMPFIVTPASLKIFKKSHRQPLSEFGDNRKTVISGLLAGCLFCVSVIGLNIFA